MNILFASALALTVSAVTPASSQAPAGADPAPAAQTTKAPVPADYVIGPEDVLTILFWRDDKMGGEVIVRPDGRISIPLLNDIPAVGLTPEQLRVDIETRARKLLAEPAVSVVVKAINSRKVHILGNVVRPGVYPLAGDLDVLQLIAVAGGLQEWSDQKNIIIIRKEVAQERTLKFNFKDVSRGKNLQQNVQLRPGDTVIVP